MITFSNGTVADADEVNRNFGELADLVQDDDGDTLIQVEESEDEDKIRFDTGGTERLIIEDNDIHFKRNAGFTETDNGNSSSADTIDWKTSNKQKSTLTDDCTFTFTAPINPCSLILKLIQDGSGSHTVTWPGTVKWSAATAPLLSTGAADVDIIAFYWDGTNYFGQASLDFGVPA